jgi:hypothetical protein
MYRKTTTTLNTASISCRINCSIHGDTEASVFNATMDIKVFDWEQNGRNKCITEAEPCIVSFPFSFKLVWTLIALYMTQLLLST